MSQILDTILKQAGTHLENRSFAEAEPLYRQAMKISPGNAAATMGLAMVYNRTGRAEQALQNLQQIWKAMESGPAKRAATSSKAAVLAQMAYALEQLGRFNEALVHFKKARSLTPSQELDGHCSRLENLLANPNALAALVHQASVLRRAGKFDEATKVYHAALQINIDDPDALHGLGLTQWAKKDMDGALPLIQQAIILNPDRAEFYNDLGMLFQERGELDKAISFHKRALRVDPTFAPAYINIGVAHKRQGNLDEAVSAYKKAIELNPNSPAAHNNLGNLLRVQGKLSEAKSELEKALQLNPSYTDAQKNLSAVLKEEQSSPKPEAIPLATPAPLATPSAPPKKASNKGKKNGRKGKKR
ncbi:MAG: tetratricopeptide repeat protein [Clostridia bacterium]|nr:tetratricopeptide repeat protein [Clostridia bacterium]